MSLRFVLESLPLKDNYVIDIGASSGAGPAFEFLIDTKYSGLAIEYSSESVQKLRENIKNPKIDIYHGKATPPSICSIFKQYNVPKSPDMLKIDIDGYDLSVIRSILSEYKPKIILAEINEKIPPPIHFEIKYSESYAWDGSHCFGFSLQAAKNVIEPFGYRVAGIHGGNNVICVSNCLFKVQDRTLDDIYTQDYSRNESVLIHYPWNADVHYWTVISNEPELLKNEIYTYFTKHNPRGKPINPDAFVLKIEK